jgi:hypothetical protein
MILSFTLKVVNHHLLANNKEDNIMDVDISDLSEDCFLNNGFLIERISDDKSRFTVDMNLYTNNNIIFGEYVDIALKEVDNIIRDKKIEEILKY